MENEAAVTQPTRSRAGRAIRARHNWVQLAKFSVVGGTGFFVNLGVFATLVHVVGINYLVAAVCSFLVAVSNNYTWNRIWTFRGHRGSVAYQGPRFFVVSVLALATNLLFLRILVAFGSPKVIAQGIAIILVMPLNFVGNKLWSFSSRRGYA
jgi:putative flippase GtrA